MSDGYSVTVWLLVSQLARVIGHDWRRVLVRGALDLEKIETADAEYDAARQLLVGLLRR